VANAEDPRFNRFIVRKSLKRIIELLDSPTDVIQKGGVMALNGLSSTASYQADILKHGAVKKMISLLRDNNDDELVLGIVLCINNLAQNEANHQSLADLGVSRILASIARNTNDPNIQSECDEALRAVDEGVLSGRRRRRARSSSVGSGSSASNLRNGIKDNVRKIIQVLINDPRNQNRLRESGVIPHLITLVASEQQNEELKGLALDALTMLSLNNVRNQNEIAMSDSNRCIAALEEVICDSMSPPKILVRAVRLIGALCRKNRMVQSLVSERHIISFLVSMLDSYDNNLKKVTLSALACTAEDNVSNKKKIASLEADRLIAKIIMKESHPSTLVAAAAQAIAALTKENPYSQNQCRKSVGHIVTLFEEAVRVPQGIAIEDHIIQEQLCAALCELARGNKKNKRIMWEMGVTKLMIEILHNANASYYCHYNALALLWECAKSTRKREKLIGNPDLIRSIRPLTESRDETVRDAANRLKERLNKY